MSPIDTLKKLTFRVLLKPAPRTQSESKAVLQQLQKLGPISTFQIVRRTQSASDHRSTADHNGAIATLIFANTTKRIDDLKRYETKQRFTVTANANIPPPHVQDPYNARGLKYRKPDLEPREIECQIIPLDKCDRPSEDERGSTIKEAGTNQYSVPFAVDRGSIFAEILAKTDVPNGLVHGLLPKLDDRHQRQAHEAIGISREGSAFVRGTIDASLQRVYGQKGWARKDTVFTSLAPRRDSRGNDNLWQEDQNRDEDVVVDGEHENPKKLYDEFASLRGFSLMRMYREAVSADQDGNSKSTKSNYMPFRDRDEH